jgi:hypothetical protein
LGCAGCRRGSDPGSGRRVPACANFHGEFSGHGRVRPGGEIAELVPEKQMMRLGSAACYLAICCGKDLARAQSGTRNGRIGWPPADSSGRRPPVGGSGRPDGGHPARWLLGVAEWCPGSGRSPEAAATPAARFNASDSPRLGPLTLFQHDREIDQVPLLAGRERPGRWRVRQSHVAACQCLWRIVKGCKYGLPCQFER